ncbi:uncharacterized protein [Halyomorpha halys]|nr:uncharacterized protein LOC106688726 isoform X2 [Halyomorpha halys]
MPKGSCPLGTDCGPVPSKTKKPKKVKPKSKRGGYESSDCSCSDCMDGSDSCSCSDCSESKTYGKKKKSSGKYRCGDCSCSDCEYEPKPQKKKKAAPKRKTTKMSRNCC